MLQDPVIKQATAQNLTRPSRRASSLPSVVIDGQLFHAVDEDGCVSFVMAELAAGRGGWIATANVDHLRRLRRCQLFRDVYMRTSLVVADGMPIVWASRLGGTPLPERVAGSNLIWSLTRTAPQHGRRVFLLGGNPGAAIEAARILREQIPGLVVAGTACPPFGFEKDEAMMADLRRQLRDSGSDIVYVGLGSPKQELFIDQMIDELPRAWWIGVGISFSFVSGEVLRAPKLFQRVGLEWLYRLVQEPRRLAGRYLVQGVPFAVGLLVRSLWRRMVKDPAPSGKA